MDQAFLFLDAEDSGKLGVVHRRQFQKIDVSIQLIIINTILQLLRGFLI